MTSYSTEVSPIVFLVSESNFFVVATYHHA